MLQGVSAQNRKEKLLPIMGAPFRQYLKKCPCLVEALLRIIRNDPWRVFELLQKKKVDLVELISRLNWTVWKKNWKTSAICQSDAWPVSVWTKSEILKSETRKKMIRNVFRGREHSASVVLPFNQVKIWGLLKNSASGCFHCKRLAGDGRKSRSKHRRMWDRTEHQWRAGQGKPGQVEAKWAKPAQYCGRLAQVSLSASILWHIGSRLTFWHNIVTGYPSTHFWKIKNLTCKVGQSAAPDMCKPNALVTRILNPGGQLVHGAFYVCVGHN